MNRCVGIVNLDENENKMNELVKNRTLAAVPFAGRYRIIDFVISNMTNSGIDTVGVFTKNKSRSLLEHLSNGRPWDLHRKQGGLKIFNFGDIDPFYEDVNNFNQNMEFMNYSCCEYVLLSSSYMICNIDYSKAVDEHINSNNDITLIYKNIDNTDEKFENCQMIKKDVNGRIVAIRKNTGSAENIDISMEMYIMKKELFMDIVTESVKTGVYKKVKEYIQSNIEELVVGGYEFKGYLACINSVNNYYDANMDLLNDEVSKELFYSASRIYTRVKDEPPTQYSGNAKVENSMIANGCHIEGTVKNSLIFRKVTVKPGVELNNCIIMQNTIIEKNAKLINVIVDKGRIIMENEDCSGSESLPLVI